MHLADKQADANPEEGKLSTESRTYSRAFENMVTEGDDDIVGLLAYALLKQNIREDAARGIKVAGAFRDPTPVTVKLYRSSAESILGNFAARAIDDARPEIQESAVLGALHNMQGDITSHVTRRTGAVTAILTNIIAWAVTGFLTIVIILLVAVSDAGSKFVEGIGGAVRGGEITAEPDQPDNGASVQE